jgi:hypothetical protein
MSDPKPAEYKAFDAKNPADIKLLQEKINEFNALNKPTQGEPAPAIETTGKLDPATKAAWIKFKKETFADGTLNAGYLKERFKITAPQGEKEYDATNPPAELVKAVQQKLKLEPTGTLDDATKAAIKQDKAEHWIDGRINQGALEKLESEIASRKSAQGIFSNKLVTGGLIVAGVGIAAATAYALSGNAEGTTR